MTAAFWRRVSDSVYSVAFFRRLLAASIAAGTLITVAPRAQAATIVFNDTFGPTSTSSVNTGTMGTPPTAQTPANPSYDGTAYQQIASKAYNPAPPTITSTITSGHLKFGIAATSSGINQLQALFTRYPVTLTNPGDYIEVAIVFTDQAGVFNSTVNNAMMIGLYNGNQQQPYRGGQANSTVALAGGVEGWMGYVGRVYVSGSTSNSNALLYRAAQTSTTASNQDLIFTSGFMTLAGTTSNSTEPAALTVGSQYTEVLRLTMASPTTLTVAQSLYSGTDTTATALFTQSTTTTSIQTAAFDGLAVGYRAAGVATTMDLNSIKVVTTGTVLVVPQILTPPQGQTKTVGDALTLSVVADGGGGTTLSYQWKKGGTDIPGATSASYSIGSVALGDAGDYTVVVTDAAGSTTSAVATLTVSGGAVAPQILTQPSGATLLAGAAQTFTVLASGTEPLTYQWQKSSDGVAAYADIVGATGTSYSIASAALADTGYYQVVVTNAQGHATSTPVLLTVNQAPAITSQPAGATLAVGAALNLSVTATGMPAPAYQWQKNGTAIPGATNATYSVASVSGADTGAYSVVVTNSVPNGTVTSTAVSVAVLSPSMAVSAATPVNNATAVLADTRLTLTFNTAPALGAAGNIKIYDAADDSVVETIDLLAAGAAKNALRAAGAISTLDLPVAVKTIGGAANWNYYPLIVSGNTVTIHPRNGVLVRGRSYYVQIDPGVFLDSTGLSFAGITGKTTWAFSTSTATPASATQLTVAADGSGDFYTVQAAVDYVPAGNTAPTTISIKNGTYFEIIYFSGKHNLTFLGQNAALTKIVYPTNNTFNGGGSSYHRGTFYGQGVHDIVVANLTIQNSTPQGGSQAEALILTGTTASSTDTPPVVFSTGQNIVTNVKLYSYQDTLQINGQCYVSDSYIEGDVDFLWGTGPVFFANCDLRMKLRSGTPGYFSQVRNSQNNHGFVFRGCRFTAEAGQTGASLGRIDPNTAQFPYSEVVLLDAVFGDSGNNNFLSTTVGASGSNFVGAWWLLNNVTSDSAATNVHNWDNNTRDYLGAAPVFNAAGTRPAFTIMPTDAPTLANYGDIVWVLNTRTTGIVNTAWTPALAPIIVAQPSAASAATGTGASFSVGVIGVPAATYQWRKGGVDLTGATSATYTIASTVLGDAGDYTVVVTNASGSVTSAAATLSVGALPTITTQPVAQQGVAAGTPVTFSVAASGSGLTYQWQKDGTNVAGATASTLTLANPRAADAGDYTVIVTSAAGSVTSGAGHLTVAPAGGLAWQSYDQTGARLSADAAAFDPATNVYTFTVAANSTVTLVTSSFVPLVLSKPATGSTNLPVTFSMMVSGGYGTGGSNQFHYTGFGLFNDGGTAPAGTGNFTDDKGLWIELYQSTGAVSMKPQSVTSGTPFCPVSLFQSDINTPYGMGTGTGGALGTISDNLLVDMIVRPAASAAGAVTLGTNANAVGVSGGVLLDHATGGLVLNRRVYSSSSTGLSVVSASITFNEFGYHFQNATDAAVTLQLGNFAGITTVPYFTTQPQVHGTVTVGDSITLTAVAAGGATTYQWQVSTDSGAHFSNIDTTANASGATAALTLTNVQLSAAAVYQLVASNAAGSVTSVPTTLAVTATNFAPVIELQPPSATRLAGTAYALRVIASGSAPVTYQWKKNGTAVSGATSATLSFASLAPADAGDYSVVITNGVGTVTSSTATLVVQYVPAITAQPVGANVTPGAPVNLAVTVDALPAATYQWKKNNVAINGATSSTYTIASAAAADTGNYTVVVTNVAGNVTSAIAPVNVLSSALTLSSSSAILAAGGGAYPETPITLTFSAPITAGLNGAIKIYDAANPGTPVDTISFSSPAARTATAAILALPTKTKTVGTLAGFNYYPVTISGSTATIYPANGALTYGKSYYVTIDPGVFVDGTGLAFAGVSSNTAIAFSTRTAAPVGGTTVLTVAKDGSGDFCTLQAALDWVPAANTTPTRIMIKDGTYSEIVYWTAKDQLTIVGQSRTGTIVGYPNNNTLNPQGTNGRAAFEGRNSTGTVLANLTVKNFTAFGGSQAEAIYFNNPDTAQTTITNVNLSSFQDTLNVNGPTYVSDSYIEGDTDFMWGNGPVFFSNCELKMLHSTTFYTQVRNPATNHGFVYLNCLFSADTGVTGSFLGRLNQNAPAYTEVVLLNCREADTTLNALAWDPNGITDRSNTLCVEYKPIKQSDSTAVTVTGRVAWSFQWTSPANDTQVANYSNPFWVLNTQKDGTAKATPTTWTPALAPVFVTQPVGAAASAGQAVSLTVGTVGVPSTVTYQWKKNGVDLPGATAATYSIASAAAADSGSYTVTATNSAGSTTSATAVLSVDGATVAPTVDTPPANRTVTVGSNVTLTVAAAGTGTLSYQWKKGGTALADAGRVSGSTTSALTLTGVQLADAGAYTVVVTNSAGSVTSASGTLTVNVPATPIVTTIAWSNPGAITYGTALGASQLNATASVDGSLAYTPAAGAVLSAGVQELSVTFTPTDTASYTGATAKVSLTVNKAQPSVTWTAPAAIVAGTALGAAQLKATASVDGTFAYTPAAGTMLGAGADQTLSVTFTPADQTNYTTATATTKITVTAVGPTITTQPVGLSIKTGASATFTVVASGTLPLSYQWWKDGKAIAGATSATFTLPAAEVPDTGKYTVVVANSVGSVTSEAATLTVAPPNYAGIYFGQFGSGGNWALYVRTDNTGTFIAYLPQRQSALYLDLLVNADGSFTVTGSEIKPLGGDTRSAASVAGSAADRSAQATGFTLSGQITSGGVSGAVTGLGETFTGAVDTPTGGSASQAGFYTASAVGTGSGATYVIVGASGGAVVVTTTPTLVGGGAGTIDTNGQLNVTSAGNGQIAVTINPQSQSIAAAVTPTGSTTPIVFAGVPDTVVATKRLVNLSTRSFVGTGSRVLIVGFVIAGPTPKQVLVRAVGPALAPLGVSGVLAQPKIQLHHGSSVVAENSGWSTAANAADIASVSSAAGAFALTDGSRDAALLVTLDPGVYSAIVSGADGGTGVALVEVYESPVDRTDPRKLINLSGRGQIGTDSNTLIAGFVIVGNTPKTVLIRAVGPGLIPLGVSDAVSAVKLALVHNSAVIASNNSWGTAATAPTVVATAATVGAFPLTDGSGDAALVVTLEPGVYSVVATGVNNATGVSLIEVYDVP